MNRGYIRGLNGLRGLAALMVFVYHVWERSGSPTYFLKIPAQFEINTNSFFRFGANGVALFFCLSGFLLSIPFWVALENPKAPFIDLKNYFRKRFYRIYPAFFVALIIYIFLHDFGHSVPIKLVHFFSHILLIHNFSEVLVYNPSPPMWSIATESQMYILLPVIFFITWHIKRIIVRELLLPILIFVIAGLIGSMYWIGANDFLGSYSVDPRLVKPYGVVLYSSPLIGLSNFCAGIMLAYFYRKAVQNLKRPYLWIDLAACVMLIGLIIVALFGWVGKIGHSPANWPGKPFCLVC